MNKGILVYNPISHGGKYCDKVIDCAIRIYAEHGLGLLLHPINTDIDGAGVGGFGDLAKKIKEEMPDHIAIAGGDGTLCKYLEYSREKDISLPVGIIPTGTANDYAGSAGIESDIEKAILRVVHGYPHPCDICSINSGYFMNVFSSGYLTCVSHTTADNLKKHFGKIAYFIHGIGEAISPRLRTMSITCDSECYSGNVLLILVMNGKTAGGMYFAKEADITDGMLDVRIFTGRSIIGTLVTAMKVFLGMRLHTNKNIICLRGKNIHIESDAHETDIDGDKGPLYPVDIKCLKGALKIIL